MTGYRDFQREMAQYRKIQHAGFSERAMETKWRRFDELVHQSDISSGRALISRCDRQLLIDLSEVSQA